MRKHIMTHHDEQGFSLLELVVAVSIMLILGVVGFVSYQSYTDNARQAALDTSANQVLTAVIAEDNSPDGDVETAVANFNQQSNEIMVDIAAATAQQVAVEATTCEGGSSVASAPGDYSHVETTRFADVQYEWTGEPGKSPSRKTVCGEVVQTNITVDPYGTHITRSWNVSNHEHSMIERVNIQDHPLGITTAIESKIRPGSDRTQSMALYNIGGPKLEEEGAYAGVWVKSTEPGMAYISLYDEHTPIPANTWTFVTSEGALSGYHPGVRLYHENQDIAYRATSWATGAIVSYDGPITEYFDGDTR